MTETLTKKFNNMKGRGEFGRRGEDEACMYLVSQGHTILERNWRCGHLEIDVITLAGDGIHFVEVKSRTTPVQGEPEDAVNAVKQKHIAKAALRYITLRKKELGENLEIFLDVAAVTFDGGDVRINYFPAAFVPIYV